MNRLVLIGLAIAFVVFLIVLESHTCFPEGSEVAAARLELKHLGTGLERFHTRFGRFPAEGEGVRALFGEGLLPGQPRTDPWGNAYEFALARTAGGRPDVRSLGRDGLRGTDDDLFLDEPRRTCFFGICF